jgi:hypothetical protein
LRVKAAMMTAKSGFVGKRETQPETGEEMFEPWLLI